MVAAMRIAKKGPIKAGGQLTVKAACVMKQHHSSAPARPLSQRDLESAILRRCAAGRDQLDKTKVPGVDIIPIRPGAAGTQPDFPRAWLRKEDKSQKRGAAASGRGHPTPDALSARW